MAKREMSRIQAIERSIIKTYRSKLWAPFIKACQEYKLVEPNDHICCCISGGKDSMLLAKLFQELLRHTDFPFEVTYLVMNPGYNEYNSEVIKKNLEILEIPAEIVQSDIFEVANNQIKNPCYLCAKMRRGALYNFAKERGCNKIALGHHFDDVIETTLMNMLNAGSFQTMLPKLHSDNFSDMELIRPLFLIREKDIINWSKHNELEFIQCACRFTEGIKHDEMHSQRAETKKLIRELSSYNKNVDKNIFMAATNVNCDKILGWKIDGLKVSFLDNYKNKGKK